MHIQTDDYKVEYNPATATVICQGFLQLASMKDYAPITALLDQATEAASQKIILDLKELKLLNSCGINMISKFVIRVRKKQKIHMVVQGSAEHEWQEKTLINLQRLMPNLQLQWEK